MLNALNNSLKSAASNSSDRLAEQILQYLIEHPDAQDTVHGILDWWLTDRRISPAMAEVEAALHLLIRRDLVKVVRAADGKEHYSLKAQREDETVKRPGSK